MGNSGLFQVAAGQVVSGVAAGLNGREDSYDRVIDRALLGLVIP